MKKSLLTILAFTVSLIVTAQHLKTPELQVYGQAMTDIGYDFNQVNPDYYDVMRPTQLPAYKNEYGTDGNVFFSVRQSMLGIKGFFWTPQGDLQVRLACDMFGVGSNAGLTTFHLLYAYIDWWRFTVGHTWSQFCDFDGFPNIVEYWGPSGMSLCKTVMVAFRPIQGANRLSIALEKPGATADEGKYSNRIELQDVKPKFSLPDLSAEFRMTRKWGYVELAGILRRIAWEDQGTDQYDLSGQAIGWGLNLSTNLNIGKKDVFKGQLITGAAIQSLMNDAPTDIGIKNDFSDSIAPVKGVALPVTGFSTYLDHSWNKKLSSSLGYSAVFNGNSDGQKEDAFRQGHYASVNLLYYPIPNLTAGIELQWIRRLNYKDGWASSATKVQFSFRYSFSLRVLKKQPE